MMGYANAVGPHFAAQMLKPFVTQAAGGHFQAFAVTGGFVAGVEVYGVKADCRFLA